jgi:hypothetical protein
VIDELCAYLLEHARREELILASPPLIAFHTDERLALGEFGIQARLVRPTGSDEQPGRSPIGAARCPSAARRTRPDDDLQHIGARGRSRWRGTTRARSATHARCWRSADAACSCRRRRHDRTQP